jgi:NADH dehydrogenase [ubiquinone] 1 alpha subcomplex assembly factor 5
MQHALRTLTRQRRLPRNKNKCNRINIASFSQVVFDTAFKAQQRNTLAAIQLRQLAANDDEEATRFDYLRDEVADRLVDRLDDLESSRTFPLAADIGCWNGHVLRAVERRGRLENATLSNFAQYDQSPGMLELAQKRSGREKESNNNNTTSFLDLSYHHLSDCAGGGEDLGLEENSLDLVFSNMWLHWCNDLPSLLIQIRRALKPDGLFLGAMLGGETLSQLRSSLVLAEQEIMGGVSPRISPQVHVGDVGMLLQGAGFNIPTVDTDLVTVEYPSPMSLMKHLQGMGESNASILRHKGPLRRDTLQVAAKEYNERYGNVEDGSVPATYQVIYMIGWAPSEDQRQPLGRGSATVNMSDLKNILENPIPSEPSAGAPDKYA